MNFAQSLHLIVQGGYAAYIVAVAFSQFGVLIILCQSVFIILCFAPVATEPYFAACS